MNNSVIRRKVVIFYIDQVNASIAPASTYIRPPSFPARILREFGDVNAGENGGDGEECSPQLL